MMTTNNLPSLLEDTMDICLTPAPEDMPVERAYVISATIRTFKGRRNVEAHLFRTGTREEELASLEGMRLVGDPIDPANPGDPKDALRAVLEAFTKEECDAVIAYLERKYADRFTVIVACPLDLPIPQGVAPLSAIPEGKTMGFIRFDTVSGYDLPFGFRGFYDLARHEPLVNEQH